MPQMLAKFSRFGQTIKFSMAIKLYTQINRNNIVEASKVVAEWLSLS